MGIRMTLLQNPDINRWWIDPSLRTIATSEEARSRLFFQFYTGNNDWDPNKNKEDIRSAQLIAERILNFVRRRQKIERRRQKDPTYCFQDWSFRFQ